VCTCDNKNPWHPCTIPYYICSLNYYHDNSMHVYIVWHVRALTAICMYEQVEGGTVASNMNPGQKMWLAYWLLGAAASVIFLNNHIDAATKDQLFPPELSMFVVFLCAICLILRAMKQHRWWESTSIASMPYHPETQFLVPPALHRSPARVLHALAPCSNGFSLQAWTKLCL